MALKAMVDNLEDVPEGVRGEYSKIDQEEHYANGKYLLVVESVGGVELDNVTGLKTALGNERDNLKIAKARITKFGDVDPEQISSMTEELTQTKKKLSDYEDDKLSLDEKTESRIGHVRQEYDAKIEQLTNNSKVELDKVLKERDVERARFDKEFGENFARFEIAKKFPEATELLLPHVMKRIEIEREGDDVRRKILNADGGELIPDSTGRTATILDLLNSMQEDPKFATAFPGLNKTGGGSSTTKGGKTIVKPFREAKTMDEKKAAIRARINARTG